MSDSSNPKQIVIVEKRSGCITALLFIIALPIILAILFFVLIVGCSCGASI